MERGVGRRTEMPNKNKIIRALTPNMNFVVPCLAWLACFRFRAGNAQCVFKDLGNRERGTATISYSEDCLGR